MRSREGTARLCYYLEVADLKSTAIHRIKCQTLAEPEEPEKTRKIFKGPEKIYV